MAIPFIVGVAAVVSLAATAVAFILDEMTEDERRHQEGLRGHIGDIHAQRAAMATASAEEKKAWLAQMANKHQQTLLAELKRLEDEHRPLFAELEKLKQVIQTELQQPNLNRLRRESLQASALMLEDAFCRYQAHADYRASLQGQLYKLASQGAHQQLLDLPLPEFNLPAEWLYVGKVVLMDATTELNRPLTYGQTLRLMREKRPEGLTDQYQRQLLADYPRQDAVPIQVVQKDRKHQSLFFGCVARGLFFEEYHRSHEPLEMKIEQSAAGGYRGSLLNGCLPVFLPKQALDAPGYQLQVGASLPVWLKSHDLCLSTAPLAQGFSHPWVTNRAPAAISAHHQRLSLVISERTQGHALLDAAHLDLEGWTLLEWNPEQSLARLKQQDLCLTVQPDPQNSTLLVTGIATQTQHDLHGLSLPFALECVDAALAQEPYIASPETFNQFLFIAQQLNLNPEAQARRQQQAEFMARWQAVLDYQQTTANEQLLDVYAAPSTADGHEWHLTLNENTLLEQEDSATLSLEDWLDELSRFQQDESGYQLELRVWKALGSDASAARWHSVARATARYCHLWLEAEAGHTRLRFTPPTNALGRSLNSGQEERWQLCLSKKDGSLHRQRLALEAFARDELVTPDLKELLLMPEYLPSQPNPYWQQRVEQGLPWHNAQLTPTQKKVIETCLTAPHLALVQGPPGTAKTTCIVELLHQLFAASSNLRVLVVSQQNAAVDNALSRFIKTGGLQNDKVKLLRLGLASKIQPELQPYILENRMTATFDAWQLAAEKAVHTSHSSQEADLLYQWQQRLRYLRQQAQPQDGERPQPDAEVAEMLLNGHHLVGATCVGLASNYLGMNRLTFDLAIIDEAGRATVPELLIPLLRSRKAILIGDHHQLPPTVAPLLREESSREALPFLNATFLETSFFEQLFYSLPDNLKARLQEQYRMVEPIGDLVAELFYTEDGQRQLFNGQGKPQEPTGLNLPALQWVKVKGRHRQGKSGKSLENPQEAAAIAHFLQQQASSQNPKQPLSVAVITPYRAQVRAIERALRNQGAKGASHRDLTLGQLHIKVDTVDSFQGSEAQLVCYSTVRTAGRLDFVLDKKRLNVACSRAEDHLVFFGDQAYLTHPQHQQGNTHNYFATIFRRCTSTH